MLIQLYTILTIFSTIAIVIGLSLTIQRLLMPFAFSILGAGVASGIIAGVLHLIIGKAKISAQKRKKKYLPHHELTGKKLAG